MESLLFPALAIVVSTLLLLLLKQLTNRKHLAKSNLPPGPWKLPILGSIHHLIGEHPHRRLRTIAKTHGPLLHLKLGEVDLVVITSPDLVREVFKTHDLKFASRPELLAGKLIFYNDSDFALAPYGKLWIQLRKISTMELLSVRRVKSFGFIREDEGNRLVESIRAAAGSTVNLSVMLLSAANATVARAAFGKECAHEQSFLSAMKKTSKYLSGFSVVDVFPSLTFLGEIARVRRGMQRVHEDLDAILNEIIEEHEAKGLKGDGEGEDLVDVLLKLQKQGGFDLPLTHNNVKAVILDIFLAGTDTSSATLEWAMTELVRNPNVMQKAQAEVRKALKGKTKVEEKDINKLTYLNNVLKETLRLHPTGPLLVPRLCRETVELGGYTVPAGSRVVVNAWAIMRDARWWEDPERFMPERYEKLEALDSGGAAAFEYIPFGGGRRICPGLAFAYASMEYWLAVLLFHFDWELPERRRPEELDVEEAFGLTLTRKNDLLLDATSVAA
ncbi:hypothetical protein HPP92_013577 [Vanilla planifolia]|uniref:Premnaspirodiene oxygenase n=1 Tax=Vanilla planifolia TaxID=51239 RepID=A0A835QNQ2_VANPL|nr:hypothetical protein HPP92_013577 [Vanilla planifolia]